MPEFAIRQLDSLDALTDYAPVWNDLWLRSDSVRPTARAEHLTIWCQAFAPRAAFCAVVVEMGGAAVAALPLVESRRWPLRVARTPGNAWSPAGELLLDRQRCGEELCRTLLGAVRRLVPGLLVVDGVVFPARASEALSTACDSRQIAHTIRHRFEVPLLRIGTSWPEYLASCSANHRRHLRRIDARARGAGEVLLERHEACDEATLEALLGECFQLEAAGWKGRERSAVLDYFPAWDYFIAQGKRLAAEGELALAMLRQNGRLTAFEYGWQARGVRAVLKIGYDESAARVSPGQLLRMRLLQELFDEGQLRWVDFLGPATRASAAWATHEYEVARIMANCGSAATGAVLAAYRMRNRPAAATGPDASAAGTRPRALAVPLPGGPYPVSPVVADLDSPAGQI